MPTTTQETNNSWQKDFITLIKQLSHTDRQSLPTVGSSPKKLIYKENKLQLFHYKPLGVKQKKTPILLTYALVNRPYITDLEPKRSLVQRLLEHGYPVYLIDWGYPDSSDKLTRLNDYINGYLHRCVQHVKRHAKRKKIDLLGICQGGVFSLCYTALHPGEIRKLITLVTPVDFHAQNGPFSTWAADLDHHNLLTTCGNIPGQLINQLFKTLKPFQLNREKYRQFDHLVNKKENLDTFLRMEQWLNDAPDLTGYAANEFWVNFYQQNYLHKGKLEIDGQPVKLSAITCPVHNVYATKDHIVPPKSTRALSQHIKPSLYSECALNGGHIGAFISLKTQQALIKSLHHFIG